MSSTSATTSSISIYVPTSPLTQEARADRIELKNLGETQALRQLEEAGADRRGIEAMQEADELVRSDEEFWEEQARSLAVFAWRGARTLAAEPPPAVRGGRRSPVHQAAAARHHVPAAAFVLALASGSCGLMKTPTRRRSP